MHVRLFSLFIVATSSLTAQVIKLDDDIELTYYNATHSSIYVGNYDGGSLADIIDLGYQGYLNYQLKSDFSLNFGAQPSLLRSSGNSFNIFVPIFVGANYGKEGLASVAISDKKLGFFVNLGAGPVVGLLNSTGTSFSGFSELGARLNFRRNDVSLSLINMSFGGGGYNGLRIAYHLDPI
jgi:hypothetical protein